MFFLIGSVVVIASVMGGYAAMGGHLGVLWQPFEYVIIMGAAIGAYVIANPKSVLINTGPAMGKLMKGARYDKDAYLELLSLLYIIFKTAKSKGMLALESHVENPVESDLFQKFPIIYNDHHALTFLCDYMRMMVLGAENPFEMETLMDEELETLHGEEAHVADAVQAIADGMPALGIVAAVLGVIKTMGSITEPPEVLGHLIGRAGTEHLIKSDPTSPRNRRLSITLLRQDGTPPKVGTSPPAQRIKSLSPAPVLAPPTPELAPATPNLTPPPPVASEDGRLILSPPKGAPKAPQRR